MILCHDKWDISFTAFSIIHTLERNVWSLIRTVMVLFIILSLVYILFIFDGIIKWPTFYFDPNANSIQTVYMFNVNEWQLIMNCMLLNIIYALQLDIGQLNLPINLFIANGQPKIADANQAMTMKCGAHFHRFYTINGNLID